MVQTVNNQRKFCEQKPHPQASPSGGQEAHFLDEEIKAPGEESRLPPWPVLITTIHTSRSTARPSREDRSVGEQSNCRSVHPGHPKITAPLVALTDSMPGRAGLSLP